MIVHLVLFTPKPSLTHDERRSFATSVVSSLRVLPGVSRAVVASTTDVGANYTGPIGQETYDYAAIIEFASIDGLRSYFQSPGHAELAQQFWRHCERTSILDLEGSEVADPDLVDKLV